MKNSPVKCSTLRHLDLFGVGTDGTDCKRAQNHEEIERGKRPERVWHAQSGEEQLHHGTENNSSNSSTTRHDPIGQWDASIEVFGDDEDSGEVTHWHAQAHDQAIGEIQRRDTGAERARHEPHDA